jgi:RNA polymerase sigma-70 factor (ECF subfamily)
MDHHDSIGLASVTVAEARLDAIPTSRQTRAIGSDRRDAPMSDDDLLDRLRRGDEGAFEHLFRTWYAPLVRLGEGMLRDRAVAEEIAQDVMLELWRRREHLSSEGTPQAYLFRSMRNRSLNHLRHLKVEKRGEPHASRAAALEPPADRVLVEQEMSEAVRVAIDQLPDRCREVFELSRLHGLKYAEIANVLGVSVKTVEAQMGRALKALRVSLAEWLPKGGVL